MDSIPLLYFLLIIIPCWCIQEFFSKEVNQLAPVTGFRLLHQGEHLQHRGDHINEFGHHQPYPDQISVHFSVFGKEFDYELAIQKHVFAPNATVLVHTDDGVLSEPPRITSYTARFEGGWISATVTPDRLIHAVITDGEEVYEINPTRFHERSMELSHFSLLERHAENGLVAFKHSSIDFQSRKCGTLSEDGETIRLSSSSASRHLLQHAARWTDCFPNPAVTRRVYVGLAADFGYSRVVSSTLNAGDILAYIGQMVTTSNEIYTDQLNVVLSIGKTVIMTTSGTYPWNYDRTGGTQACTDINTMLTNFGTWRNSVTSSPGFDQGLWMLLTDCFPPPGVVGLGYIGRLCSTTYGAAVSSYSAGMWTTYAHETGHNFGAQHTFQQGVGTTGGIMDYGDGTLNGIYQFNSPYNKPEVCGSIGPIFGGSCSGCVPLTHCFANWGQAQCGNNVVEAGEQCDDNRGCCDTTTCQFKPGTECVGGECCNSCKYAPSTKSCGSSTGFCANGVCQQSICTRYASSGFSYSGCGTSTASPCTLTCMYNGACTNAAGWRDSATGAPFDMTVPDGTVCKRGSGSIYKCSAGQCNLVSGTGTAGFAGSWAQSNWNTCSVTCGTGTQTRNVYCQDVSSNVLANSQCDPSTKPATTQTCTKPACVTYIWKNSWSICTKDCGTGTQTNTPYCQVQGKPGQVVSNSLCPKATKPATIRVCNTQACSITWQTAADWSGCSKPCGTGQMTRSVTCVQTQNGVTSTIANSACPTPVPANSTPCNTQACTSFEWFPGTWSQCSRTCGSGSQSRTIVCRNSATKVVVDPGNCVGALPPLTQQCNTVPCTGALWSATDWTNCSLDCGTGAQFRNVSCAIGPDAVDSSLCTLTKPTGAQACNSHPCPIYSWKTGPWTVCPVSCGGANTSRAVSCQNIAENPAQDVDNTLCTDPQPAPTMICNPQACPSYSWYSGDWSTCSVTCGGGSQARTVNCILNGTNTVVSNSLCTGTSPPTTQSCNMQACASYVWSTGTWSACSRKCGNGTRQRSVSCKSTLSNAIVANAKCPAPTPLQIGPCNTQDCPGTWTIGAWDNCDKPCGSGTSARIVNCVNAGTGQILGAGQCQGTKPSTTSVCNAFACPTWSTGDWEQCDVPCGDGYQNRSVVCKNFDGTPADDDLACTDPMPASSQPCNAGACAFWSAYEWSNCSSSCGGGVQSRQLACRMPDDVLGGVEADSSLCTDIPVSEQSCGEDACSDYFFQVVNLTACSVACGGGTQVGEIACLDPDSKNPVDLSFCAGTPPSTTVGCNLSPCPQYGWTVTSDWSPCTAFCGGGWQNRTISCLDTSKNAIVLDSFCSELSAPLSNQSCNTATDLNCGTFNRGVCRNYTGGYGWCKCRPGFYGDNCEFTPEIANVKMDIKHFTEGIPLGERIQVQWDTQGAMPFIAIMLDKGDWRYPMYLATEIINNQSLATQSPTYLWKISQTLPLGDDYVLIVFFSPYIYGLSDVFALADPCFYISCGAFGSCVPLEGWCDCVEGYSGQNCELSPCAAAQCNPITSNCSDSGPGAGTCICAPGWTGDRCYVPESCSFNCANGGLVTGALTNSVSEACANLSCSCFNFFGGPKCETCNVVCKNGGVPDPDCLICQCGAGTGWMGHDCTCQYYILGVHVKTETTDVEWLNNGSDLGTFKQTFGQDMALALSISPSRILVQDVIPDGIIYQGDFVGVQVLFYLTEDCVAVSLDQSNIFKAPTIAPTYYERSTVKQLFETTNSSSLDGSNPELDALVALIQSMYGDSDTILYRGYITGKINSAKDMSVVDPSKKVKEVPPPTNTSWIKTYYWIFIIIGVFLILLLVAFFVWRYNRTRSLYKKALQAQVDHAPYSDRNLTSGSDVRAIFQSGEIDRSSVADRDPTTVELASPNLPEGWTKEYEPKSNNYYYYNTKTGESRWDLPQHPA